MSPSLEFTTEGPKFKIFPNFIPEFAVKCLGRGTRHQFAPLEKFFCPLGTITLNICLLQELYRKVRGILNKLTPQKFQTLVEQMMALEIDSQEKLDNVIDLVFQKVGSKAYLQSYWALE